MKVNISHLVAEALVGKTLVGICGEKREPSVINRIEIRIEECREYAVLRMELDNGQRVEVFPDLDLEMI